MLNNILILIKNYNIWRSPSMYILKLDYHKPKLGKRYYVISSII